MKYPSILLLVLVAALPVGLRGKDPSNFDPSKKENNLAPGNEANSSTLAPQREANQRPFLRNDTVQDERFKVPETLDRKNSSLGERRAAIDLKETHEKNIIDRKTAPKPEVKVRVMNQHDGEKSRYQPKGDQIKTHEVATRFQDRVDAANTAASQSKPTLSKKTTFESLNRFLFKRNGPGTAGGRAMVTQAGNDNTPPPSQDTHTKYDVDWTKGTVTPQKPE